MMAAVGFLMITAGVILIIRAIQGEWPFAKFTLPITGPQPANPA